jgi:hypothetical protein
MDGWMDTCNIKMDLKGILYGCGLNKSGSGELSVAGFCGYGNEPSGFITC